MPLLRAASLDLVVAEEYAHAPWAGTAYATTVVGACREAGYEPDIRHRVTDLGTLLDLARSGLAVAPVPTLGRPEEDRELALRSLAEGGLRRSLFAAVRTAAPARPGLDALLAELRERVSAL